VERDVTCGNSGAISNVADTHHGVSILAPWISLQGELATSKSLNKGTTLDLGSLLASSRCKLTEANQIIGS